MALTKELKVKIDTTINAEATTKQLRELKKLLREIPAGSAEFKQVQQALADTTDKIKTATNQSEDLVDSLASAGGPIGFLASGYDKLTSSTNKWGLAWKATGIGLLVALVGQLVTAFTSNEKAMKKLEPVMNAFQQILGGIFSALEPVFNLFVDLTVKAIPYLINAIGGLYTGFAALGSFLKNFFQVQFKLFTSFGKVLKGVFTLDFDIIKEGVMDGVNAIKEGVNNVVETTKGTWDRFKKGTNEMTAIDKKNAEEREKLRKEQADKAAAAASKAEKAAAEALTKRKADLDARIQLEINKENTSKEKLTQLYKERYEAELQGQKMTDAQKQVLRDENAKKVQEALNTDKEARQKAFEEQLKQLQDYSKFELDQLNANLNSAKALYGENSAEARKVQDEIFNSQATALQKEKDLLTQKQELTDADKARIKSIGIEEQDLTTTIIVENDKRIKSDTDTFLKLQEETKKANQMAYEESMSFAQGDFELQQQILDAKVEQDKLYYEKLLANENLSAEQRKAIQDAQTANTKANADAQILIEEKKFQAQQALLGATANAITALADIVGKNTVAGKALAVAASLINTYAAIAGQLRAFSGIPVPGYAIVQAVATGLVGFKAVADIVKTQVPQGGSSGGAASQQLSSPSTAKPRGLATGGFVSGPGTGTSDSIPAMLSNGESVINARSTSMFKPLLSTINMMGGGAKFADGGMVGSSSMNDLSALMSQQQPIKTYVVASDVTSIQQFDRVSKSRSTL